ncbi:phage portal protein [Micromonospora sp. NBC_01655]|uniref:phage portal protein n=1 Tax=Micromonospora sp. NBC_01655 TaxID=2975983 RepID=UPI00224D3B9C|nr:phage portal protein [Micromonospora sp. NBC_01655]MCX4468958.1 phage portal protein [Micromonospora sp. NBC_01655]
MQRIRTAWDATVELIERAARPVDWRMFSTYGEPNAEKVLTSFQQYAERAYGGNAAVFGIVNALVRLFSEATFRLRDANKKLVDHECLRLLHEPWPNGTTGDLLARMRQDATLAGNAYVRRVGDDRLERLRPDWVTIVSWVTDGADGRQLREVVGYLYEPIGDTERDTEFYPVEEVAHWAPIPDPLANWRGMSALTPALREINADMAMTEHRDRFFRNAATPNLIIKYANKLGKDQRDRIRDSVAARHSGPANAGGTLVLDEGADPMIVGSKFSDAQFDEIMAAGENRIAVAIGVPAIVAGLKQGQDAAAWSMYRQGMRAFADTVVRPDWRSACAALARVVDVPDGYRLWFDVGDIAALQESETESATAMQTQAATASTLITAGFEPESVTAAIIAGDLSLLRHSGMVSVQMHDPNAPPPDPAADLVGDGDGPPAGDDDGDQDDPDAVDDEDDDQDDEQDDEQRRARLWDLLDELLRAWDAGLHPRDHRGRFRRIGAPDLVDGTVPVDRLPDRRLQELFHEFSNDPAVANDGRVFHLLGDEMDRRDSAAMYRALVASVPDGEQLRGLPEADVMDLYAQVSAVDRDPDMPTLDRLGAELDRRLAVEVAAREAPAREYLARDLDAMSDDELEQARQYAAQLGDVAESERVHAAWERKDERGRAAAAEAARLHQLAADRNRWASAPLASLTDADVAAAIVDIEADGYNTNDRRQARLAALRKEQHRRTEAAARDAAAAADTPTGPAWVLNPMGKVADVEFYARNFREYGGAAAGVRLDRAKRRALGLPDDADDKAVTAAEKVDPRPPAERAAMTLAWYQHAARHAAEPITEPKDSRDYGLLTGWADAPPAPPARPPLPPANVAGVAKVWAEIEQQALADRKAGDDSTARRYLGAVSRALGLPDGADPREVGKAMRVDNRTPTQRAAAYLAEYRQLAAEQDVDPGDRLRYGPPDRTPKGKAPARRGPTDAQSAEIDRLVSKGRDYLDAYAEVLGLDVDQLRREEAAAAAGGGKRGGTREALRKAYEEHTYLQYLDAELVTRGNLLSKAGRAKKIDPAALFSGPMHVARKYASEELLRYWAQNPRMTFTEFQQNVSGRAHAGREAAMAASNGRDFV